MKNLLFKYFIFSLLLGTTIYLCNYFNFNLPRFVRFYVNDFLIVPIVLFICLQILKRTKNDKNYIISLPLTLYVCLMYTVLFEYIFPRYLERYTKDIIDIILYFASGFLFYTLQKKQK